MKACSGASPLEPLRWAQAESNAGNATLFTNEGNGTPLYASPGARSYSTRPPLP
jgi:hypothetical protein